MKLSVRATYGLHLMIELARHYEQGPVRLKTVAAATGISEKQLSLLVMNLKKQKMVMTYRTRANGGYLLSRQPSDISLLEIIEALEGPLGLVGCIDTLTYCNKHKQCSCRPVWQWMSQALRKELACHSLEEVARKGNTGCGPGCST